MSSLVNISDQRFEASAKSSRRRKPPAERTVWVLKPDVCVVDISMPIMGGIEAAAQMKSCGSRVKIIFLTVHEDPDFRGLPLDAGALGYVVKSRVVTDLSPAIRAALADRLFVSPCRTVPA